MDKVNKSIILRESQVLRLVNEALSSVLYHWTSIRAAWNIFRSGRMFCQSALAGGGADDMSSKYRFYVSMARNRTNLEGFSSTYSDACARIEFDGDALNERFAGHAVNYWGADEGLLNKWGYMRRATGVENGVRYWYKEADSVPEGASVRGMSKYPMHVSDRSPEYIKIGNQYFHKEAEPMNIGKEIGFKYEPVEGSSIPADVNVGDISSFKFKYPNEYSPEYVRFNDRIWHKERSVPEELQKHHDNEMEDRLFTNKPYIDGIRGYIKRIDLLVSDWGGLDEGSKRIAYNFSMYDICHIYNNKDDFNKQSENTINGKIRDMDSAYEKYGKVFGDDRTGGYVVDALAGFLGLITLPLSRDSDKRNGVIAKYLKDGGMSSEIRPVIKKVSSLYGNISMLIGNLQSDIQNVSKSPTQKGQDALGLITTIFNKKGYKSWQDVKERIEREINPDNYKFEDIDTNIKLKRRILVLNEYREYDVTDDEDTDFWHIFDLDGKRDRYYFIESLLDSVKYATNGNWEHEGEWINNVRGRDKERFQKYLQNLAHKRVPLSVMFGIFEQIGYSKERFLEDFSWSVEYKEEEFDYWSYKWSNLLTPFKGNGEYNSDDRDQYADKIFQKKN